MICSTSDEATVLLCALKSSGVAGVDILFTLGVKFRVTSEKYSQECCDFSDCCSTYIRRIQILYKGRDVQVGFTDFIRINNAIRYTENRWKWFQPENLAKPGTYTWRNLEICSRT